MSSTTESKKNIPQHIVIIPDGNRRWAKKRGRPAFFGHKAGAETVQKILEEALKLDIQCLTIWGCSVSNALFERYFKRLLSAKALAERGVRVRVLGQWREFFPAACQKVISELEKSTENNTKHNLTFLLAYNGTSDMLQAVREVAVLRQKRPRTPIDGNLLKSYLSTKELPAVDLAIRTGGDPHFSTGFMMWDMADAQLYFTETLWPDFSAREFKKALDEYAKSERRGGK
jgi:undecaprenyl diphosphate synthase